MKKAFLAGFLAVILLSVTFSSATFHTVAPQGTLSIFGSDGTSENALNQKQTIRLFTDTPVDPTLRLIFQYNDPDHGTGSISEHWKTIESMKTVSQYSTSNLGDRVRETEFIPSEVGMIRDGYNYEFRAVIGRDITEAGNNNGFFGSFVSYTGYAKFSEAKDPTTNEPDNKLYGLTCLECVKNFQMGYVTTTNVCESGNATNSHVSSASAKNENWVYFSQDAIRDGAATSYPERYGGTYSCETPPGSESDDPVIEDPVITDPCLSCVAQFKMGYVTTTGACESGNATNSHVSSASAANGNWVYFSQDAIRNGAATSYPEIYGGTYSCETPPTGNNVDDEQNDDSTRLLTGLTCLQCVKNFKMGYVTTTGNCESGNAKSSDVSSASAANNNWVYFSQDVIRDSAASSYPELYGGTYSCENPPTGSSSSDTGNPETSACLECVKKSKTGYVTTTGNCELGSAQKSDISSASTTNSNWVYFGTERMKNSAASTYPEIYGGTYSCENPPN